MNKIFIASLLCFFCTISFAQNKPNVIIVFMDDMGYGDLENYGAVGYKTPNLNRLAMNGMRFTNFYTPQATCTASRAALLTGTYPNRMNMYGAFSPNAGIGLHPNEVTIAEMELQ